MRRKNEGSQSKAKNDSHVPTKKELITAQAKSDHHHKHGESVVDQKSKEKPQPPEDTSHGHHPRRKGKAVGIDLITHGSTSDPVGDLQRHDSAIKLQAAARGKQARQKHARKADVITKAIAGY